MADYTVQAGDTLTKIAKAHGTSVSELAKQNGIKDVNKIEIGKELSLGKTTASAPKPQQEQTVGLDTLETQSKKDSTDLVKGTALGFGAAYVGANVYDDVKKYAPKVKAKTVNAYAHMKATAKHNAKAVRTFVAQKAKHAAKSAELHYAFGKDAVQKGVQRSGNGVKNVAHNVATKARHAAKSAELHYAFGKDAVQKGVKNTTNNIRTGVQSAASKTKNIAGKAIHKAKVGGRYTRFIANTKVAPKLIKGASRYATPLAIAFEAGKCYKAFDNGAVEGRKQIAKSTCSLAGGWAGAKIGASLGSFAGPVGTVIGGVAGGILGYCLGEKLCS